MKLVNRCANVSLYENKIRINKEINKDIPSKTNL